MPEVIFTHENPPIPTRAFDWRAGFNGREEEGRYGFGRTKLAAALALYRETETPEETNAAIAAIIRADAEALPAGCLLERAGMIRAAVLVEGL
jgi:hypothetical protein